MEATLSLDNQLQPSETTTKMELLTLQLAQMKDTIMKMARFAVRCPEAVYTFYI